MNAMHWNVRNEHQRERLITFLQKMEIPPCGVLVEACDADTKRTVDQNRLLWVSAYQPIALFLSENSGKVITTEMVHQVAKDRFLEPIIVTLNGKTKRYPGSTTKLGKKAFSEYLEQVYAWGCDMGVSFG